MNRKLYKHEDNAFGRLNAGISAGTLTIPLQSGQGALLPVTANGAATSLGSSTVLNDTGIQAALGTFGVGDIIENVTDGSYAIIKSVSTNQIVTTRLKGGSDNTWQNSDVWAVNRFIVTLVKYDVDGETVLQREKVLVESISGDNLTVNASGRGFDGSTAASFATGDYCYLYMTSCALDGIQQAIAQAYVDIDNLISQGSGEIYAADSVGTDAYAVTLVPAPTALVTGMVVNFKAGTANTGNATLNLNGLGAINILKNHDQTLDTNDIEVGQVVTVIYDGTVWQMQSQVANLYASVVGVQNSQYVYAADSVGSDAYAITLAPAVTAYVTGQSFYFKAGTANTGAATLNVNGLGAKTIKKSYNSDLVTGDILANQIVLVTYDGTNFQMMSPVAAAGLRVKTIFTTRDVSVTGVQTISGVGFTPKMLMISASLDNGGGSNGGHPIMSNGSYDGTTQGVNYSLCDTGNPVNAYADGTSGAIVYLYDNGVSATVGASAVASNFGADGCDLTWSKTSFPTGNAKMVLTFFG